MESKSSTDVYFDIERELSATDELGHWQIDLFNDLIAARSADAIQSSNKKTQ